MGCKKSNYIAHLRGSTKIFIISNCGSQLWVTIMCPEISGLVSKLAHLSSVLLLPCWLLVRAKSYWLSQDYWLRSVVMKLGLSFLALAYSPFSNSRPNFILIRKKISCLCLKKKCREYKNSKELWFCILPLFSQFNIESLFTATRRDTFWWRISQTITFIYNFPCNFLAELPFRKKKLQKGIKIKH